MTDTVLTAPEAPAAALSAASSGLPAPAADPAAAAAALPTADPAPDYSSLALPEGAMADTALMDSFKGLAGEHGLSAEGAQKMVDLHMQAIKAQQDAYHQTISEWAQSVAHDREIGGANQDHAVGLAKQALTAFGTPALLDVLNQSGLGNHPEVIRTFYRMGKAVAEDGRKLQGNSSAVDPLRALYPTMFKD